jgi:hypothetical protein
MKSSALALLVTSLAMVQPLLAAPVSAPEAEAAPIAEPEIEARAGYGDYKGYGKVTFY